MPMDNIKKYNKGDKFSLSLNDIKKTPGYPSRSGLKKGPVVVIECIEEIPCDVCEKVCNKNSISIGKPITNLPVLNSGSCNACGNCVIKCPGLAVFIINNSFSDKEAAISLPYELLPLPDKGDKVHALDRNGEYVCDAKIYKIRASKKLNHTNIVTIIVPKEFSEKVRFFKRSE
jgi:Fe-S-cluster-containing hydrogenase component 2